MNLMGHFWTFAKLSVLIMAVTVTLVILVDPIRDRVKFLRSTPRRVIRLWVMNCGVYLSFLLLFLPYCYDSVNWGDPHRYIRPVLLASYKSLRMFVMGVSFDELLKIVPAKETISRAVFSLYTVALYFTAPALMVGNVLSIFRDFTGGLYLRYFCRRRIFVMSDLNPQSLALAESIAQAEEADKDWIVFCSVSTKEEKQQHTMFREKHINAICLKKDVCHLKFRKKGEQITYFLIGGNETENTTLAKRLHEKLKNTPRKTAVRVFSADPITEYILDTLPYGDNVVSEKFEQLVTEAAEKSEFLPDLEKDFHKLLGNYSIRPVNHVELLVWDVLKGDSRKQLSEILNSGQDTVSITILGMGRYGVQFLKTAVWFYQRSGTRVEFNIFDIGGKNGDPMQRLKQECPGLIKNNPSTEDGDACYNIRFFDMDCFSFDVDEQPVAVQKRMERTDLVFIALGNDDADARAAKAMQTVFARIAAKAKTTVPFIYAVVHDKEKAANLNAAEIAVAGAEKRRLWYVGTQSNCYTYQKLICDMEKEEKQAFRYHLEWVKNQYQLRKCYEAAQNQDTSCEDLAACLAFKEELDQELQGKELKWGDADYFKDEDGNVDYNRLPELSLLKAEVKKYICGSYFRNSSIAKAVHKNALAQWEKNPKCEGHSPVCNCEHCISSRITEHMRWNAYMRAQGYQRGSLKDTTAKLHYDLKPWQELPCQTRYKD